MSSTVSDKPRVVKPSAVADQLLFIGGKFVSALSGKTFPAINPATEETLCQVAEADKVDVDIAYYQAILQGGKASTAAAVTALYPMATVLLAMLLLQEKPRPLQVAGIAASLCAIYLFNIGTNTDVFSPWLIYALLPIICWGSAGLLSKLSTNDISAELSTCWFLAAFMPIAVVIVATQPMSWTLTGGDWLLVTVLGACYGLGNWMVLAAYRNQSKASIVTPLCGLYPLVTIPLAVVVLGEQVRDWEWAGIALALAAALALSYEKPAPIILEAVAVNEFPPTPNVAITPAGIQTDGT